MGNSNSHASPLENDHQIQDIYIPHPQLTNAKVIIQGNAKYLQVHHANPSESIHQQWLNKLQVCLQNITVHDRDTSIFMLPTNNYYLKTSLCGNTGISVFQYDFYPMILTEEILNRAKSNEPFSEKQVWYILYTLICAGHYFHSSNECIGDIRGDNIFMNVDGKLKVSLEESWLYSKTIQQRFRQKQMLFVSPQYLQAMNNKSIITKQMKILSQNFAIGMTIAEVILLEDLSTIYKNINNILLFNDQSYQNVIKKIFNLKYYSTKILKIITGLISFQEVDRLDVKHLYQLLRNQQTSINSCQNFTLTTKRLQDILGPKYARIEKQWQSNVKSEGKYVDWSKMFNVERSETKSQISSIPLKGHQRQTISSNEIQSPLRRDISDSLNFSLSNATKLVNVFDNSEQPIENYLMRSQPHIKDNAFNNISENQEFKINLTANNSDHDASNHQDPILQDPSSKDPSSKDPSSQDHLIYATPYHLFHKDSFKSAQKQSNQQIYAQNQLNFVTTEKPKIKIQQNDNESHEQSSNGNGDFTSPDLRIREKSNEEIFSFKSPSNNLIGDKDQNIETMHENNFNRIISQCDTNLLSLEEENQKNRKSDGSYVFSKINGKTSEDSQSIHISKIQPPLRSLDTFVTYQYSSSSSRNDLQNDQPNHSEFEENLITSEKRRKTYNDVKLKFKEEGVQRFTRDAKSPKDFERFQRNRQTIRDVEDQINNSKHLFKN